MSIWPQKIELSEIGLNGAGALIAGIAGWISITIIMFVFWNLIDISWNIINRGIGQSGSPLFPLMLSVITLIGTTISVFFTMKMLSLTSPGRYTNNRIVYSQIGFFTIFLYILITPIYIWTGLLDYSNIMLVFLVHVLLLKFGMSIILETINNYRYVMIWIYGSFLGLIIAGIATLAIFSSFDSGVAKLISLVALLPIINFAMMVSKQLFEFAYYKYYAYSGIDYLGDIFERVENEEEELLREEEEKNMI